MLLLYVTVFICNKSLLVYNPNYTFYFPPAWYLKNLMFHLIPIRRLGNGPLWRSWVLHLRLVWDVLMRRRCYVHLRRRHDVPIKRCGDVPLRRLGNVPSRRRWMFHLGRTCNVVGTYREMSLRRRLDVLMLGGILQQNVLLLNH